MFHIELVRYELVKGLLLYYWLAVLATNDKTVTYFFWLHVIIISYDRLKNVAQIGSVFCCFFLFMFWNIFLLFLRFYDSLSILLYTTRNLFQSFEWVFGQIKCNLFYVSCHLELFEAFGLHCWSHWICGSKWLQVTLSSVLFKTISIVLVLQQL